VGGGKGVSLGFASLYDKVVHTPPVSYDEMKIDNTAFKEHWM